MATSVQCIRCGYLYAWNPQAYEIEDCIMDPELLRARPQEKFPFKPDELVSGKPARFPIRQAYHPFEVKHHKLQDIHEFKCYKTGKGLIGYAMNCSKFEDFDELFGTRDCPSYFSYQVGFSAPQHLQLEIESKRATHQEKFEKTFRERQDKVERIGLVIAGLVALISVASFALSVITYLRPGTPIC